MKNLLFIFFAMISFLASSQYYTPAQLNTIHTTKAAFEGDMYLDTINKRYYIGLTTGELTLIEHIDSITFKNDSLSIYQNDSIYSVKIASGGESIDSMKYENDTLKLYTSDSLFQVKIVPDFIINGLDNSTVYYINSGSSSGSGPGVPDSNCTAEVRVKRLIEANSDYGFRGQAFICCDDNIWTCGDAGSTAIPMPFGHPSTGQNAIRPTILPEDPTNTPRKGRWKYIWVTHNVLWALTDSGELYSAGDAVSGQLGNGSTTVDHNFLTKHAFFETLGTKITYLYPGSFNYSSLTYSSVFALTEDGDVYSWGENQYGQMGIGNTTDQLTPVKIAALDVPFIVKLSIGDTRYSSCFAIDNANNIYSWGYNVSGGLANGSTIGNINTPAIIAGIKASEVKVTGFRTMTRIITKDSNTMAAGENGDRSIGDNSATDRTTFTNPTINTTNTEIQNNVAEIDVWCFSANCGSLLVTYDRELWVCGNNTDRQQGIGNTTVDVGVFQKPVAGFQGLIKKAIFVGSDNGEVSIAVLDTNGRIWTCGDNRRGQLSDGTLVAYTPGLFRLVISEVGNSVKFIDIKAFGRTTVPGFTALTEDGRVLSVGSDSDEQTGLSNFPGGNVTILKILKFEPY